jgi:hypothetical protein
MSRLRQVHRLARLGAAGGVTVLLTTGILITAPSAAFAAGKPMPVYTVINFDNVSSGTIVSNQYASRGITFDQAPSGPAGYMPKVLTSPGAYSPPNVLDIGLSGLCGTASGLYAHFAAPRNLVSIRVGDLQSSAGEQVTLSGYNQNGTPIPAATETVTTSGGSGVHTPMLITDPNSHISFFHLAPANATCFAIDNLSFDPVPDFVTVTNPGPQDSYRGFHTALQITAASSLAYPLTCQATGLPPGPWSSTPPPA